MTDQAQKIRLQKSNTPKKVQRKTSEPTETPERSQAPQEEGSKLFADVNVTMKSGHLTKDAEIVGNNTYAKLRIACNKQYESEGEIKTNTSYFDALVSHNLKEAFDTAKELHKGDWVYLKGEDSTRSFDTPEGYRKTANTIFAYHVVLKKAKAMSVSQDKPGAVEPT